MDSSDIYLAGSYLKNNPTWHVEGSPWKARHIVDLLHRNKIKPRNVAEVGCGAGEILVQLQDQLDESVDFHGYDISPQAFEIAKGRMRSRLQFYHKDLLGEDCHFDLLLVIDVIEHVDDYMGFMRKLSTKANHIVFHIPLEISAQTALRSSSFVRAREEVGHLHHFTEETVLATIRDTGYEVLDFFLTAGSIELEGGGWKRKLASVPRRCLAAFSPSIASKILGGFSIMVLAKPLSKVPRPPFAHEHEGEM